MKDSFALLPVDCSEREKKVAEGCECEKRKQEVRIGIRP